MMGLVICFKGGFIKVNIGTDWILLVGIQDSIEDYLQVFDELFGNASHNDLQKANRPLNNFIFVSLWLLRFFQQLQHYWHHLTQQCQNECSQLLCFSFRNTFQNCK